MPLIMPIRDLRNTSEISELAHKQQEPIFITKNGYSDLVVMSSELYDQFIKTNRIDQIIYESEKEMNEGAKSIDLDDAFKKLSKKYYEEIFEYIANDLQSPEYAKGQTDRLWKSLKTLEIFPSSHQERLVGNYAGKGYRQLLIDNYLAIFKIDEQRKIVKIITIQYQGRNL